MNRRYFLATCLAVPIVGAIPYRYAIAAAHREPLESPFEAANVRRLAQELAQKTFQPPDNSLPDQLKDLDYDKYRKIRFVPEKALWRGDPLPFQIQLFHRGFFFSNRVDIFEVSQGRARQIQY